MLVAEWNSLLPTNAVVASRDQLDPQRQQTVTFQPQGRRGRLSFGFPLMIR